jgi:hypothetical protein
MPGLNHQIIYRENENLLDEEWGNIKFNPLSLNGIEISEENYFEIHDDIMRWFIDIFNWVQMYNPAKKEQVNGFCYWGVTIIERQNVNKLYKIICSLIDLFENSPSEIILTGNYCVTDECYNKIKINKDNMMKKLIKFRNLLEKIINNGGYILHSGI